MLNIRVIVLVCVISGFCATGVLGTLSYLSFLEITTQQKKMDGFKDEMDDLEDDMDDALDVMKKNEIWKEGYGYVANGDLHPGDPGYDQTIAGAAAYDAALADYEDARDDYQDAAKDYEKAASKQKDALVLTTIYLSVGSSVLTASSIATIYLILKRKR